MQQFCQQSVKASVAFCFQIQSGKRFLFLKLSGSPVTVNPHQDLMYRNARDCVEPYSGVSIEDVMWFQNSRNFNSKISIFKA